MFEAGILTAIGIIWLLYWFDLKKVAALAPLIDIASFILLPIMFLGTFAGMVTGFFAGSIISLFLRIIRRTTGKPISLKFVRFEGEWIPRPRWVSAQNDLV